MRRTIKRGQIFYANIPTSCGSAYFGLRPVLILSNNTNNRYSSVLTCIPISSSPARAKANLPTHVYIKEGGGLKRPSTLMCENISNYSVDILQNCIGEIPEDSEVMKQVERAVMIQIGVI